MPPKSNAPKVAVVIPCYKVTAHIKAVVKSIPASVTKIYCVDDACPESSGDFIKKASDDKRLKVIKHDLNKGVGGAVVTGYMAALKDKMDIVIKLDGDGQMDPKLIPAFVKPIAEGQADYTKGNRFHRVEDVKGMPLIRLLGNAALSFMTKLSSGYWQSFDPTNGYTAIHANVLAALPLHKLSERYFFESDILFRLNVLRAKVIDIPMTAHYGEEESNLNISRIILPFLGGHTKNFFKRFFYNYILRDFNIASLEAVLGLPLLIWGLWFGMSAWAQSEATGQLASAGTVMLAALPILVGVQFLLSFLQYDIEATPRESIHGKL